MTGLIPWPRLVTDLRGDPVPVYEFAGFLKNLGERSVIGSRSVQSAVSLVVGDSQGIVPSAMQENLTQFSSGLDKLNQDYVDAGQAAQQYARLLEELRNRHDLLEKQRNVLIEYITKLKIVGDFGGYLDSIGKFDRENLDFAFQITSAEDGFIDALGLQKFPDPDTGNWVGTISVADLDRQNRAKLDSRLQILENKQHLSSKEFNELLNLRVIKKQLADIESQVDPITGKHIVAQLYQFDANAYNGDGKALISVGDMDRADNVSFSFPGIFSTMQTVPRLGGNVLNLYRQARKDAPDKSFAGVIALGYDAPSGLGIVSQTIYADYARQGGLEIAREIDEFATIRKYAGTGQSDNPADDKVHITVIGHSYGSTTASYAADDGRLKGTIDDLILIGSPGAGPAHHASDFHLGSDHVFVGRDLIDPVSHIGGLIGRVQEVPVIGIAGDVVRATGIDLGDDPYSQEFGAVQFDARNNVGDADLTHLVASHLFYYRPDTPSLNNISTIVTGHDSDH